MRGRRPPHRRQPHEADLGRHQPGGNRPQRELLADLVRPSKLCAVVKADAYGHGMIPVARTAVEAGASMLAVALVDEGRQLREVGIESPILLLSEPGPTSSPRWSSFASSPPCTKERAWARGRRRSFSRPRTPARPSQARHRHGRVGAPPAEVMIMADSIAERDVLELAGVWTHCAVADEPDNPFTAYQIEQFNHLLSRLKLAGHHDYCRHLANSAVAMAHPAGRFDMVRCGIAIYGIPRRLPWPAACRSSRP